MRREKCGERGEVKKVKLRSKEEACEGIACVHARWGCCTQCMYHNRSSERTMHVCAAHSQMDRILYPATVTKNPSKTICTVELFLTISHESNTFSKEPP